MELVVHALVVLPLLEGDERVLPPPAPAAAAVAAVPSPEGGDRVAPPVTATEGGDRVVYALSPLLSAVAGWLKKAKRSVEYRSR